MARYVRLRDVLIGVEGLALLRHLYDGSEADAERRIAEIRAIVDDPTLTDGEWTEEMDPRAGYGAWFDLIVCGLALAHISELRPAVAELARLLRPGGRPVSSVLHPFQGQLGWHAPFADARGRRGFVHEFPHRHADYFAAPGAAGLRTTAITEPLLGPEEVTAKRRAFTRVPDAVLAAYAGLPGVLVWEAERP